MLFHGGHEFGAFRMRHGDQVFDAHGVKHLPAEAISHDSRADALARRIDASRRARRPAANHQHIEGALVFQGFRRALSRARVELGENLFEAHAPLREGLAVEIDGGHRHDLAGLDLLLKQRAVDGHMLDARIEGAHQVQRLHHIRAVLAGEREIGLEAEVALEMPDLLQNLRRFLRRVPANLQKRQHEGVEFVAHGQACEMHGDVGAHALDGEGRLAGVVALHKRDLVTEGGDLFQQLAHFLRLRAVIERGHELDGHGDSREIALQLGLEIGVQHRGAPKRGSPGGRACPGK